jgi:hypothetical protein
MNIRNYGELLEFATGKECLFYKEFGSYCGDYIAILKGDKGNIEIWKGTYGCCVYCDWLESKKDGEDEISIDKALKYIKDEKPFLIIPKNKISVLTDSDDIASFFPANTRDKYDWWDWSDIKEILSNFKN